MPNTPFDPWRFVMENAKTSGHGFVKTSLFHVPYVMNDDGSLEALIPYWVIERADRYNMDVLCADPKNNTYTLLWRGR